MKNQKNNKVFHMDKTIVRYQRKIDKLGLDNTFDANWFLSIRFITSCFLSSRSCCILKALLNSILCTKITFVRHVSVIRNSRSQGKSSSP